MSDYPSCNSFPSCWLGCSAWSSYDHQRLVVGGRIISLLQAIDSGCCWGYQNEGWLTTRNRQSDWSCEFVRYASSPALVRSLYYLIKELLSGHSADGQLSLETRIHLSWFVSRTEDCVDNSILSFGPNEFDSCRNRNSNYSATRVALSTTVATGSTL